MARGFDCCNAGRVFSKQSFRNNHVRYIPRWWKIINLEVCITFYYNKVSSWEYTVDTLVMYLPDTRFFHAAIVYYSWQTPALEILTAREKFKNVQSKTSATNHRTTIVYKIKNLRSSSVATMPALTASDTTQARLQWRLSANWSANARRQCRFQPLRFEWSESRRGRGKPARWRPSHNVT